MSLFSEAMKKDGAAKEEKKGPASMFGAAASAIKSAHEEAAGKDLKPLEEIAKEVIRGNWGVGQDRINKLTAAGYDASAVQKLVNEMMKK